MAERVKVVACANGRSVLLDARVARILVAKGSHEYATEQVTSEATAEAKPAQKKRTYKRRDLKAEDGP